MKPHKHAELIKQWADGATIQMKSKVDGGWWDVPFNNPDWDENYEYRIKPEEKKIVERWMFAKLVDNTWVALPTMYSNIEALRKLSGIYKRLDWSRTEFEE